MGTEKQEVLIIGGGPAGATSAIKLLERGVTPLIVEREKFPRYHVGEAMTGEGGAIVRELGIHEKLTEEHHTIKHGVNVFGSRGHSDWWVPVMQRTEDKELHEVFTYQGFRSLIDKMLFFMPQSLIGALEYLGADSHFENIAKGIVDSRDLLYFLSVCFVGLYAAALGMREKY